MTDDPGLMIAAIVLTVLILWVFSRITAKVDEWRRTWKNIGDWNE
jgi:hypothetical protein